MKMRKRRQVNSAVAIVGFVCFAIVCFAQNQLSELSDQRYTDPKGYFSIVPPSMWNIQEYPSDVRGKVAFQSSESNIDFRILVNSVDFDTFDQLLEFCQNMEKRIGIDMKIEQYDFYGQLAVRRSFEIQGQRYLYIDFLLGQIDHNLAYGAPLSKFEQYLPIILKSMETYEPVLKEISGIESVDHLVAKKLRLGQLMLESHLYDLALEYVSEGLTLAPDNQELLKLKLEIDTCIKK